MTLAAFLSVAISLHRFLLQLNDILRAIVLTMATVHAVNSLNFLRI